MQEPFRNALRHTVDELAADPEVSIVVLFGSVQQGEGSAGSDLDFYVGTTGRVYQRRARTVAGVVAELFCNPTPRLRQMFRDEDHVAIHAFATGELLLDRHGEGRVLADLARSLWAKGPRPLTAEAAARRRYEITALASDVEGVNPGLPEAALVAGLLVPLALEGYCAFNRLWLDQPKHLIRRVSETAPDLGRAASRFYEQGLVPALAVEIADRVLAPVGGRLLAYSSEPKIYSPGT